MAEERQWKGRTDGLPWMIRCLVAVMRVVDRRVIYCFMALIVPFYMLFNHKGYISIYRFFRRRLGFGPLKSFCKVYANHFRFGQVIIDRYAAYAGKKFSYTIDGNELFLKLMESDGGFVQLSSHAGSFEMVGYGLTSDLKRINGLLFAGESQVMKDFRRSILASHNIGLIEVDGTMSHIFAMNAALDRGEIVSMTGDRLLGSPKALKCMFMGAEAKFPMGPFALAVQKEVPMLAMFAMRENARSYKVFVRRIESDAELPLRARMTAMAQRFAAELEEIVRLYPTQWFNYYDFWA
ncbi:MAG: acyltransferase [Bacteroidetes bacterium]|nr:acyltransferase [Candidatus Colenecus caballi]